MSSETSNIYLAGFMGSGKSTLGPILANVFGYGFVDLDEQIEAVAKKSVTAIFSDDGEEGFRRMELSVLREVSGLGRTVVSLGGGTVARQENIDLMKSTGLLVYLKSSPDEIFKRIRCKPGRPLLRRVDGAPMEDAELMSRIESMLAEREAFYAQAALVLVTDGRRIGLTVDELTRRIRGLIG